MIDLPTPNLAAALSKPLYHIEKLIIEKSTAIESWFRQQWLETPAPITSSVDLRHSGFKLAPVDTNLFPAGFNNIHVDLHPLCIQAFQSVISSIFPNCIKILIIPEDHTRNEYYLQSLSILRDLLIQAGYDTRIGSLDPNLSTNREFLINGQTLAIEPAFREENRLKLKDFNPCLILLNNDLSTGIPEALLGLEQNVQAAAKLGWSSRLKSEHFRQYDSVVNDFTNLLDFDPWIINPLFTAVANIDFVSQEGIPELASQTKQLLLAIQAKYKAYKIQEPPFVAVKADNGTYGMSVMMIRNADELLSLNRKQRTKMASSKGSQRVNKLIIQEGVYSFETMSNGAVAEPVIYMIGQYVVGGFYRVHKERGTDGNLNAPGMEFEPLSFVNPCNSPSKNLEPIECPNRFYVYGVIARLAALAAAREASELRS